MTKTEGNIVDKQMPADSKIEDMVKVVEKAFKEVRKRYSEAHPPKKRVRDPEKPTKPTAPAKTFKPGTRLPGSNDSIWKVAQKSNGAFYWVEVNQGGEQMMQDFLGGLAGRVRFA